MFFSRNRPRSVYPRDYTVEVETRWVFLHWLSRGRIARRALVRIQFTMFKPCPDCYQAVLDEVSRDLKAKHVDSDERTGRIQLVVVDSNTGGEILGEDFFEVIESIENRIDKCDQGSHYDHELAA